MATAEQIQLLPEVEAFISQGLIGAWINGRACEGSDGTFTTLNPGNGQKISEIAACSPVDVNCAVDVALETFNHSEWSKMPANERGVLLHRLAEAVESKKHVFAQLEALDAGKVLSQAEGDVQNFIDTIRYFTDLAQHAQLRNVLAVRGHDAWTVRHPWGPCGFIVPWNFPFLLVGWGIGPALAAGNTVVIKPAEDTPLTALYLGQVAKEAGIPDGVINIVSGYGETAGAALAGNPKLKRMSFTGSPEVGRMVAEACGRNLVPVKCELGGKGAAVIFDDVNIPETAKKLVEAITFHTGQVCCDATRWLVHENIYDEFIDECVVRLNRIKVGYQLDRGTQMGPVVNEKQRQRIIGYLDKGTKSGADFVLEGGACEVEGSGEGYYVKPALLAGPLDNVAAREEIFGPVAYLGKFQSESEGIERANDTDYGLANSVWTADLARAQRVAEAFNAGNGWINAHNVIAHGIPYAGVNNSGMGGGVLSPETYFDYLRSISVVRPLS
ncbi:MAG: aldehyde dehydrogenase family protein [Planctomycetota bacterium]|nr:aldehyde dehydrogenase family protein [Planctomycetota bacterium]MEC8591308.1 aldehyde dehydrogenase family protein [Planctomycetota bacterium]MEC8863772.1 aldehyde dehydrogenase family protein [Planctomycetota bacterium]